MGDLYYTTNSGDTQSVNFNVAADGTTGVNNDMMFVCGNITTPIFATALTADDGFLTSNTLTETPCVPPSDSRLTVASLGVAAPDDWRCPTEIHPEGCFMIQWNSSGGLMPGADTYL